MVEDRAVGCRHSLDRLASVRRLVPGPLAWLGRSRLPRMAAVVLAGGLGLACALQAAEILLTPDDVPASGLVVGKADLTGAARWCKQGAVVPESVAGIDAATGEKVPLQFIPDADFNSSNHIAGTVVARFPRPGPARLKLHFGTGAPAAANPGTAGAWDGRVVGKDSAAEHDAARQGGLPWRITFQNSGRVFDSLRWNNRLHHRERGGYCVCDDPHPSVERVAAGPLCTVVRVKGRYVQGEKQPASRPAAVYDWYYFADTPWVYVTAAIHQEQPARWHELHPLELNYPGNLMPQWAGGEPLEEGRFQGTLKSFPQARWGMIHDGTNGVAMFRCGQVLLHDGGPGAYLQGHGDSAWQEWNTSDRGFDAWLWIGSSTQPVADAGAAVKSFAAGGRWSVTVDEIEAHTEAVRAKLAGASATSRQKAWWRVQGARQLQAQGLLEAAWQVADGHRPTNWTTLQAGDLGLILQSASDGIRVQDLFDTSADRSFVTGSPLPLFTLTLREAGKDANLTMTADHGWQEVMIQPDRAPNAKAKGLRLEWRKPSDSRLGGLRVIAWVTPDAEAQALRWRLTVEGQPAPWSVWRVVFPQVAVADPGPQGAVFFPKAAGQVERGVWQRGFRFTGTYPGGWTSMQYMAAYDEARRTGLYVAVHDPWGSTKDLLVESRLPEHAVVLAVDHPAPDMGAAGNRFELSGEAVWQRLAGDWFDASVIYRDWVRKEAKWYPKLGAEGRGDTAPWMRELSLWAQGSGPSSQCVPEVQAFTKHLGAPAAVHWYNWHQIPFDNDYPHYFPTKPGFAEGVRELQASGTYVMPYINGRLWDSRDDSTNDVEFTKVARPAVTKNEKGEPYLESYGSKEADGSPVKLGVMCPSTALWQERIRDIVLRLMNECGVKGVYIDQIAAAQPTLCFDASHHHPLGGGHWWTEGYWQMLESIRRQMPPGCMLTTECNGEPFIRWFDGYLTWHWQYDGQVPAFPAVYGGAVQMFGRSYGGGPTHDLALRMRAGQQLVFGEQVGWMGPGVVNEKENAAFLRQVVQLRRQLVKYFYTGEMARPPKLAGKVPTVRADWQWGGVSWVTTDAVLTGAWRQPSAKRIVLLFANVSAEPVTATVEFDARACGFGKRGVRITPVGTGDSFTTSADIRREVVFPPQTALAWEITAP